MHLKVVYIWCTRSDCFEKILVRTRRRVKWAHVDSYNCFSNTAIHEDLGSFLKEKKSIEVYIASIVIFTILNSYYNFFNINCSNKLADSRSEPHRLYLRMRCVLDSKTFPKRSVVMPSFLNIPIIYEWKYILIREMKKNYYWQFLISATKNVILTCHLKKFLNDASSPSRVNTRTCSF